MNKLILSFLVLLCSFQIGFSQRFIRYNHLGYDPERPKKLIILSDNNCKNEVWKITDSDNTVVLTDTIGNRITGMGEYTPKLFNYAVDFSALNKEGTYTFSLKQAKPITLVIKKQPYAFVTEEIIKYLRQQRSGTDLAIDHNKSHMGDTSCVIYHKATTENNSWEATSSTANMVGGWYDAGDYIKFTLTTAYTTYLLLRSYEAYPELYDKTIYSKSDLPDLLDEAKWGLDYLVKTMPSEDEFIIQVGGHDDHQQGLRLPDEDKLDGKRECYSAISPTQMGYTAAALALGARIFNDAGKTKDAKHYETMALKIFEAAASAKAELAWVEKGWEKFYADNTKDDNMGLAAIELYYLTDKAYYLEKAKKYAADAGSAYWVSWGSAHMLLHNRLLNTYDQSKNFITTDLSNFKSIAKMENNIWGVPHSFTWATLYSFFGVANGAIGYTKASNNDDYIQLAHNVIDYTFGMNNWGTAFIAHKEIPNSVKNIYAQVYKLQPDKFPSGAIAEGPGDTKTHDELDQYFKIPENDPYKEFNTPLFVFYDNNSDFQCMETTITGLSDGLYLLTLYSKLYKE